MIGLWLLRLKNDNEGLRERLRRMYRRIGDEDGASAPLRAEALRLLLSIMRHDDTGSRWTIDDEDVTWLSQSRSAGPFLADLLEERRSRSRTMR
jgi:hypothetical protein